MSIRTIRKLVYELFNKDVSFSDLELLEIFSWPPNSFVFTSVILEESGAYRNVVDPPGDWPPSLNEHWADEINNEGETWRQTEFDNGGVFSEKLEKIFSMLIICEELPIHEIGDQDCWELCKAILELHALADAACAGIGLPLDHESIQNGQVNTLDLPLHRKAFYLLFTRGSLSTVDVAQARILPKMRTPQVGISLRSLSHHLAFVRSEVDVKWSWQPITGIDFDLMSMNLLVIPWPYQVDATNFKVDEGNLRNLDRSQFGFFSYESKKKITEKFLADLINKAIKKSGKIHGVVLPENALLESEITLFERVLLKFNIGFYITGIRGKNKNYARIGGLLAGQYFHFKQDKHHRWIIDEPQIYAYHLGSSFLPSRKYWENVKVEPRTINFICQNDWLSICTLICEDLARHDPVSQILRAVGPNLLIALLFDGPQLGNRWPGRYASVFADDPGSSILTVTSLGMAVRSKPPGKVESRVIALWKDSKNGTVEVSLGSNQNAAILTISARFKKEWTADGRSCEENSGLLELSSVETF